MMKWLRSLMQIQQRASRVLSINNRNLGFVHPYNQRKHFPIANDKMMCKQVLSSAGVVVPATYYAYSYFYELRNLQDDLSALQDFVIKPANGSAGNGIIVINRQADGGWYSVGGTFYSLDDIKKHISDIIFGVFSHDMQDAAMIEQRILQHQYTNDIYDLGLSDVRIILFDSKPVMAMLRIPSSESEGKANLHQGAVGVGVDLDTGKTNYATKGGEAISHHPDSGASLLGMQVAYWDQAIAMAITAAESVPLKYLGVDIAISEQGPVMIEINARPGIEIQNVNNKVMRPILDQIHVEVISKMRSVN